MRLALASDYVHFWWLSIGLGVVVLLVVIVLLAMLASLIGDIRRKADLLSATADAMVATTRDTRPLDEAAEATGRLREEAELQAGDGGHR
jgi:type II secretory pathway pseudopilin PulG